MGVDGQRHAPAALPPGKEKFIDRDNKKSILKNSNGDYDDDDDDDNNNNNNMIVEIKIIKIGHAS